MLNKTITTLFFILLSTCSSVSIASNPSLRDVCKANNGIIVTGYIAQAGLSHGKDNTWPALHIKFHDTNGVDSYYFFTEGKNGRGDGLLQSFYNLTSQSRYLREKVDLCISADDKNEILGIENYPL